MKRKLMALVLCVLVLASVLPPGLAAEEAPEADPEALLKEVIVLKLGHHAAVCNGGVAAIYFGERSVTAYARDGRTYLPVRFLAQRLGATVDWDNDTQTVKLEKDGKRVEMTIGADTYVVDGDMVFPLDAPAELTPSTDGNFRTMVPARFISEALGYYIEWEPTRDMVVIAPPELNWNSAGEAESLTLDQAILKLAMFGNLV